MTKRVSPITKFLLLTAISASSVAAWAQTSSTTTSVPAVSAASTAAPNAGSSVVAIAPKKSLRQKLSEKLTLSYYNMVTGPGLDGNFNASKGINNEPTQMESFHAARIGYRINPAVDVGAQLRYIHTFTSKDRDNNVLAGKNYEMLNPGAYARLRNAVDNKYINLSLQTGVQIPTRDVDVNTRKMTGAFLLTQNLTFKVPNPKWSLSASITEVFRHYRTSDASIRKGLNARTLVIYPNISYNFNPIIGLQTYAQFTRNQALNTALDDSVRDDADYLRMGPTIAPNDWLQVYIPIQMYLYDPKLQTASLGLEISAGL